MKKKVISFIVVFVTLTPLYSQQVIISGWARDTTRDRSFVMITINDTLNHPKYRDTANWKEYMQLTADSNYVFHATDYDQPDSLKGFFRVRARLTDSLAFYSMHYIKQVHAVKDLLNRETIFITLTPEPCQTYIACKDTIGEHFVFVGKKISLEYAPYIYYCNMIPFDSKFDAVYHVQENLYNKLPGDTIRFTAYDHYGRPRFGNYETVMLFVSKYCDKLVHQKYTFYPLYETEDGRLAAPLPTWEYSRLDSNSKIKPEKIKFKKSIEIDVSNYDKKNLEANYPSTYYKVENGKAIPLYGNYMPELIEIQKQTVLKARGILLK